MTAKYITSLFISCVCCITAYSQKNDAPFTLSGKMETLPLLYPWLQTENAAGISSIKGSIGRTFAGASVEQGDFRRPQQPSNSGQLLFLSERYQQLSRGYVYGSFQFKQQRDQDVKMTQVLDPYRGNPYILADSLGGDWTKQFYELNLKAATASLAGNKLHLGIGLVFKAGTGARQNDPRPFNTSNELTLTPSAIWNITGNSKLGVNGMFNIYKEEIITESKNYTLNQRRYMLTGLGTYFVSDFFSNPSTRNYKGKTYGGDLQYEWRKNNLTWLSSIGYRDRTEEVVDGTDRPRKGGTLEEKQYKALTSIQYAARKYNHILLAEWTQYDRSGMEEHQKFNSESDKLIWETFLKTALTTSLVTRGSLSYQLFKPRNQQEFNWIINAGVAFNGLDNKYNYPRSLQIVDMMDYSIGGRKSWRCHGKNNLIAGINATYTSRVTSKEENNLDPGTTNLVTWQFFYPDHGYLSSEAWKAELMLQYAFSIPKVAGAEFFVRGNGMLRQQTGKEYFGVNGNRTQFVITIGAFY